MAKENIGNGLGAVETGTFTFTSTCVAGTTGHGAHSCANGMNAVPGTVAVAGAIVTVPGTITIAGTPIPAHSEDVLLLSGEAAAPAE